MITLMKGNDLWERYCTFYEKDFPDQLEYSKGRMEQYFRRWKETDLAKTLCRGTPAKFQVVPITTYSDYPMLSELGRKIAEAIERNPRKPRELLKEYYDRVSRGIGSSLNRYMAEPFHFCAKTTGTTGESKWIAHGETFLKSMVQGSVACLAFSCSDGWGETKLRIGDKCLNMSASIPYISGWGAWGSKHLFQLIPPIEVTDNLRDMQQKYLLMLETIRKGEKVSAGGGIGSMFYMMCKYFVEPEEFYQEHYRSMDFGLKKVLLRLKLLQLEMSRKEKKRITDFMPLKGVLISGVDARLYIEFFRKEFGLTPLNVYGSTEVGSVMRGDPDRKTDLVPDLGNSYLEFQDEDGEVRDIDELKRGKVYGLVVTPFGSIVYRYDMEDLLRVVDFRDDGMPVFSFESRKTTLIRLYSWYRVTPNVVVQALSNAGLRSSDKWAVVKLLKPREHLHFLMERAWPYSEREAEKIIFNSLMEAYRVIPHSGRTLRDYIADFRIRDPSEVVKVEYLRPGAFVRYSIIRAKMGAPLGQYKPPKIIPTERMEVYDTLRSA